MNEALKKFLMEAASYHQMQAASFHYNYLMCMDAFNNQWVDSAWDEPDNIFFNNAQLFMNSQQDHSELAWIILNILVNHSDLNFDVDLFAAMGDYMDYANNAYYDRGER